MSNKLDTHIALYEMLLHKTRMHRPRWRAIGPNSYGMSVGEYRFIIYPTGAGLGDTHVTVYEGDIFFCGIFCPDNKLYEAIKENVLSFDAAVDALTERLRAT